jgi:hypothetical protein
MCKTGLKILLGLLMLSFLQYACGGMPRDFGRVSTWQPAAPSLPTATPKATTMVTPAAARTGVNCNVPRKAYDWSYQNRKQTSGTGGIACDAVFVFTNHFPETVRLIVKTDFDNNAMKWEKWSLFSIAPGGTWESKVSRSEYKSGVITHNGVLSVLVFRDAQECSTLFTEDRKTFWEIEALPVAPFYCQ